MTRVYRFSVTIETGVGDPVSRVVEVPWNDPQFAGDVAVAQICGARRPIRTPVVLFLGVVEVYP